MRVPRSRRDTRAAILGYLWCSGGAFRPDLAAGVGLTEASISRIVAEIRLEKLVDETKRTAPYQGGPSSFLTLSNHYCVGTLELSNNSVNVGAGNLRGDILFSERHDLPDGADAEEVERVIAAAIANLAERISRRAIGLVHVAVSIPGYRPDQASNPIIALRPTFIDREMQRRLPGVPVTLANAIVTRAIAHRLHIGLGHVGGPYFYVFIGHGVGGAFVDEFAESGDVIACEIGHMVFDLRGPRCRCGHAGCLEAYVSTAAIAPILKTTEPELTALGDRWHDGLKISARAEAELASRLTLLGAAIGNTLNSSPIRRVVIAGWPTGLHDKAHAAVMAGIEASLLGGVEGLALSFATTGVREPASGLALATFSFIRRGGERASAGATTAGVDVTEQPTDKKRGRHP